MTCCGFDCILIFYKAMDVWAQSYKEMYWCNAFIQIILFFCFSQMDSAKQICKSYFLLWSLYSISQCCLYIVGGWISSLGALCRPWYGAIYSHCLLCHYCRRRHAVFNWEFSYFLFCSLIDCWLIKRRTRLVFVKSLETYCTYTGYHHYLIVRHC